MIRSKSELSAQLKALRNSIQLERSRETSSPPDSEETAVTLPSASYESLIQEKERKIGSLQLALSDLQLRLAEQVNTAHTGSKKLEEALLQSKLENNRLAEAVESYQILLQDRTLKGEYHLMGIEGVREADDLNSSRATSPSSGDQDHTATSLALEIEEAEESDKDSKIRGDSPQKKSQTLTFSASIRSTTSKRL